MYEPRVVKRSRTGFLVDIARLWCILGCLLAPDVFSQEIPNSPEKKKYQIQIEDEIERGVESGDNREKDTEDIVISGEDEMLIRTAKSDTSIIPPTDASSVRWIQDTSRLDKDGKGRVKRNEKNGDIVFGYGMYNNSFLKFDMAKSDLFGLYKIRYIRDNIASEGFGGNSILNSEKSSDELDLTVGSRVSPRYLLMVKARYFGDTLGFQDNPSFTGLTRKWGGLTIQNNIKPDNQQSLNIDARGDYVHSTYAPGNRPGVDPLYLDGGLMLNWTYIFQSKISVETNIGYDFLSMTDIAARASQASTANGELLFHFPLARAWPAKNIPWQLDLTIGGGGFYKDNIRVQPTAKVYLDSKFSAWNSRLGAEKNLENLSIDQAHLSGYYEKPLFYSHPNSLWDFFWDNSFSIGNQNVVKAKAGYRKYEFYQNPRLDTDLLYSRVFAAYGEMYARLNWEYSFSGNFLLDTSLEANSDRKAVNMRPWISFLVVLGYDSERLDAAISLKAVGPRKLDVVSLKEYYLLGASVKYWFTPSFSLMAGGENILNQKYTEYYPYLNSGIKIFAGCYVKI